MESVLAQDSGSEGMEIKVADNHITTDGPNHLSKWRPRSDCGKGRDLCGKRLRHQTFKWI